ncbi:CmcI family methyltransferase [Cerasibacillus sp. JNUCC 74]
MNKKQSSLKEKINKKIMRQGGIPTILDNFILNELYNGNKSTLLKKIITSDKLSAARYQPILERIEKTNGSELPFLSRLYSQGKNEVYRWKGQPLFKSIYDKAIYELLIYETCPSTIIEFGATETSLRWLKSVINQYQYKTRLIGINIVNINNKDELEYLNINANDIQDEKYNKFFINLEHPLIIIEDCHVNTKGILEFFSDLIHPGDYIIIEDSISKQKEIKQWAINRINFFVDTRYTDFFGINTVSATNSIITKVGD